MHVVMASAALHVLLVSAALHVVLVSATPAHRHALAPNLHAEERLLCKHPNLHWVLSRQRDVRLLGKHYGSEKAQYWPDPEYVPACRPLCPVQPCMPYCSARYGCLV